MGAASLSQPGARHTAEGEHVQAVRAMAVRAGVGSALAGSTLATDGAAQTAVESIAGTESTEEAGQLVVRRKVTWLKHAIEAFWPARPRVLLQSPKLDILSTLPFSGFMTMDIRSGLDVAFVGEHARGDGTL